jgi:NADPH:quinone reductase-like Zn-dependent oxidoreductase
MMKAWELRAFGRENLRLVDKPVPRPGPTDVLMRVKAVSLNYRDKLVVEGQYNPGMKFPVTQVADAVGEVVDMGKEVTRFKIGDRLVTQYCTRWIDGEPQGDESTHTLGNTIQGALAEYLVLDQNAVVHAASYMSDEEAAAVPCAGLTAWYALVEKGQLKAEDVVLVQGTGGVSLFGLQIARALGAQVIVTSSSDEKLARVNALGATHGVNYLRTPEWAQEALRLTSKRGVDHVLEVAGGKSLAQSMSAIKPGGVISVIGILDGFSSEIPVFQLLVKQIVLRGISVGPRRSLEDLIRMLERYELRPVIDTVYSFEDAMAAYDHLYRGAFGKIVIRVSE